MKLVAKKIYHRLAAPLHARIDRLRDEIEANRMLIAQERVREITQRPVERLQDAELRVFSEWGEDGILQYLLSRVSIENETFIEFGVEDYRESNTRFLLMNNGWRGLVMDGDPQNVERIRRRDLHRRHDLTAVCAFVTRDNINDLIRANLGSGDIGLLSVDVDGNDYWIWKAIDVVSPRVVVVEYNSVFGREAAVTVPYRPDFYRTKAHFSNLYFGASLPALCKLAEEKGYVFVGSNSAGVNAFFVRRDVSAGLPAPSCRDGYVQSRIRESKDPKGELTYLRGADRLKQIEHLEVVDVESGRLVRLGSVANG